MESYKRKPLLYADLFKPQKKDLGLVEEQPARSISINISEKGPGTGGYSCSSGFSTPFGSELGSSGTSASEDEEFMAELSRQMAECMLKDDEKNDDDDNDNKSSDGSCRVTEDFEVYQLKNQPVEPVVGEGRGRQSQRTGKNYVNYRRNGQGIGGSGMKAIFLDRSGSSYGSCGTGVFLPCFPNDPTPAKKKPGCSTVLIPTRVLQTLELHFSKLSESSSPTRYDMPWTQRSRVKDSRNDQLSQQNGDPIFQNSPANGEEEDDTHMQLPQEWTY